MKRLLLLFIATIFLISMVSADTLQEFYDTGQDNNDNIYDSYQNAQVFRVNSTGQNDTYTIHKVSLLMKITGSPTDDLQVQITGLNTNAANSFTNNNTLSFGKVSVGNFTTSYAWINISMTNFTVTKGNYYAIVLNVTGAGTDGSNNYNWGIDLGGSYADGTGQDTDSTGMVWSNQAWDNMFRIYNHTAASPVSSATVTLISPTDNQIITNVGANFTAHYNISDAAANNITWRNATYYVWKNGVLFNTTYYPLNQINQTNSTQFIDDFTLNNYKWNVYAWYGNSTYHNFTYASANFSFIVGASLLNTTYDAIIYDTDNSTFSANVTLLNTTTIYSANLIYNGTSYLASYTSAGGGNYILTRTIDIPVTYVNTNRSWFFKLNYDSGGFLSENLSSFNQSVLQSRFVSCNATYTTLGINYTIYNETSLTRLVSTFKATHAWYLGSGSVKKNISYDLSGLSNYTFCIEPNQTFYVDSSIKLHAEGFFDRTYNLPKQRINNTIIDKALYLLDTAVGSSIITEFRSTQLVPLPGYYLTILRYYSDLGRYIPVHTDKTDNFGVVVASLVESTVKYKFNYTDYNGSAVKETPDDVTIACRSAICVLTFLKEDIITDFDTFKNLTNYEYTLTFDNTTNTFLYTWNDNRGELPHHRLLVQRIAANGTTIVCNVSSTDLIGSLSCAVGSSYASYSAQAFRHASPERRVAILTQKVGDISGRFGIEGLLWSFILLMMMIAVGYWSPPIGIGLYMAVFIVLGITGIIYVNPAIIAAEIAIGVAFIWAFRS